MKTDRILAAFRSHENAGDGSSFSSHDQGWHRCMEQDAVRNAAGKHFRHPAVIVRAHCDEVGLYRAALSRMKAAGCWTSHNVRMEGVSAGSRVRQRSTAWRPASIKAWRNSSYP